MKAGLASINKPHTDNIFSGEKTIEWRKLPLPIGLNYVYETKNKGGCGKVIGNMHIVRNIRFKSVADIPTELIKLGCVDIPFLIAYANGGTIYANVIENAQRFEKPKELSEFSKVGFDKPIPFKRPPQSWAYCKLGV